MELLIALVPMLAWGSIGLVSGKLGGDANQQTFGMTVGAMLFSIVAFLVVRPELSPFVVIVGLLSGFFWCLGQNGQFHGMSYMGVSVALPMSTGMQLVLNTVAGAVIFHEWTKGMDFLLGPLALAFLVAGSVLTSRRDKQGIAPANKMYDFGRGLRSLLVSTVGFGTYTILITWANVDPLAIILPQSVGMVFGAFVFSYGRLTIDKYVWRNTASGLLWGIGNICMLLSIQSIGLAVGFSLSQMGIIISTLGGIFILGERKTKKELVYVIMGCLFVIFGGMILGYMKTI